MKYKVLERVPNFVDTDRPMEEFTAGSLEDLLNGFPANWANDPKFLRFSKSLHPTLMHGYKYLLMCEMKDGTFWVIGFLEDAIPGLPDLDIDACNRLKALHNALN